VGVASPVEFQAAVASASSSLGGGHDLELRPYVVGRELTPMELRVVRESNGNPRGTGSRERVQNDLALLVSEITAAAVAVDQARPRQLCADPLPDVVTPRRLATDHPGIGDGVPFALVDLPDQQRQEIRTWEPGAGGSLLIYGAETSGTSSVLASLALGAAERYPADDVHLYVIDAGALSALSELPHTGAVVRPDEVERIARMVQIVGGMIDGRGATSDGELRGAASSKHGSPFPHVVVMIDDVGALRQQLGDRSELDSERDSEVDREPGKVWAGIDRIVRDGPAVGVCTVATARGERDVPAGFAAHFPSRLVLQLADTSGYASFGFRSIDVPRFVPGRALDPADRTELQIVQPPVSLAGAVAALASEPARFHPPVPVEVPTS
jgi:S-DNA-T family DNA segregation ATPase FtsK/SpoIIIE